MKRAVLWVVLSALGCSAVPGQAKDARAGYDWPAGYRNCMKYGGYKKKYEQNCTNRNWTLVRSATGGPNVKVHRAYARNLSDKQKKRVLKAAGLPQDGNPFADSNRLEGLRTAKNKVLVPTIYARVVPLSDAKSLVQRGDKRWFVYDHASGEKTAPPSWQRLTWHALSKEGLPNTAIIQRDIQNDGTRTLVVLGPNAEELVTIENAFGAPGTPAKWKRNLPQLGAHTFLNYLLVNQRDPSTGDVGSVAVAYDGSWRKQMPDAAFFKSVWKSGRYGSDIRERTRALIEVGPAPAVMGPAATNLYWFLNDRDGGAAEKPDNVLGVVPILTDYRGFPQIKSYIVVSTNSIEQLQYWIVGDRGHLSTVKMMDRLLTPAFENELRPVNGVYLTEEDVVIKPAIANPNGLWYANKISANNTAANGIIGGTVPGVLDKKIWAPRGQTPIEALADYPYALAKRKGYAAQKRAFYASPEQVAKRESLRRFNEDLARRNWEEQERRRQGTSAPTFGDLVREWQGELNRKALTQRWRCRDVQPGIEKCAYY